MRVAVTYTRLISEKVRFFFHVTFLAAESVEDLFCC
jgi:hypothetical protein